MNDTVGQVIEVLKARRLKGERRVWLGPAAQAALFTPVSVAPRSIVLPSPPPAVAPPVVCPAGPEPVVAALRPAVSAGGPVSPPPPTRAATWGAGAIPRTPPRAAADLPPLDLSNLSLEEVRGLVAGCTRCGLCHSGRRQTVFSDGDPKAELMFIGEGPGEDEDIQGVPFVGRAGQLLTKMIEAMKYQRQAVYICNIVKCRPPGNRQPADEEGKACLPYLLRQIELVRPRCIVLLGATPLWHLLAEKGITRIRGQWRKFEGIPVMPTYHPAFLLRVPDRKRECWTDLQQVMKLLGKLS